MRLTLQTRLVEDIVVIRCQGRIVSGDEVEALEKELEKQTQFRKRVVLQLAEADYIDSSGLGALVRMSGVLRAKGGDLKLCELSRFVLQVLDVTSLASIFHTYATEREALDAFSTAQPGGRDAVESPATRIVCIDPSGDLLAYVDALLRRSGYEVFATRRLGEAVALVDATRPRLVICGPGVRGLPTCEAAIHKFQRSAPDVQILHLHADFSTAEAGQAGVELMNRVQSLLAT